MVTTTTLKELREAGACTTRYRHLCKGLGGANKYGRDTPISILTILEINGILDAGWAMEHCPGLKPLDDDYQSKCEPLDADYWAKRKPLDDSYRAKCKLIVDDYWAKCADLLRSIVEGK